MKNTNAKTKYLVICNAFKKLENLLREGKYPELAIIVNHLIYLWLKDISDK